MSTVGSRPKMVFAVSLGCPKNRVDTERLLGELAGRDFVLCTEPEDADLAVVNTCGFIEEARQESLQVIGEVASRIKKGAVMAVAGCMTALFRAELEQVVPKDTIFVGPGERLGVGLMGHAGPDAPQWNARVLSTARHVAYLKVAEGCSRRCSFCMIPRIRGPQRSVRPEDLVQEANALAGVGVKELVLVAQDLTHYGTDLPYREATLAGLLRRLAREVEGIEWIRLMYLYPRDISDELLDVVASESKVLPYLDLPVQHGDDRVLRAMRRGTSRLGLLGLIQRVRERIPRVMLRTTYMVGFPGEEEEAFQNLISFAREARFDLAGVFKYSREPHTEAYDCPMHVSEEVKEAREARLLQVLSELAHERRLKMIGQVHKAVVEGPGVARLWFQAPEVDGVAFLQDHRLDGIPQGSFIDVKITGLAGSDFECALPL